MKILLVIVLAFVLSGCFPGLRNGPGGESGKPGEFLKGKAVGGFPALPLYPKAKLVETYGSGNSYGASAYTGDDIAKVVKFYNESLALVGWESQVVQDGAGYFTFDVQNQTQVGTVIVNPAADGETVAITLSVSAR